MKLIPREFFLNCMMDTLEGNTMFLIAAATSKRRWRKLLIRATNSSVILEFLETAYRVQRVIIYL